MRFPNIGERRTFEAGANHVAKADRKIGRLIKARGVIQFAAGGDPFESLVEAIISQQLNGWVARKIFGRLKEAAKSDPITVDALGALTTPQMRKAGVSPQKISYLNDLISRVKDGRLDLEGLKDKPDDEVVRVLDEVKGIGPWTAHMFLIFTLGRPDVLPVDDLGVRMTVQKVYSLRKLPDAKRIERIAKAWHPYSSIASLYLWHAKDSA